MSPTTPTVRASLTSTTSTALVVALLGVGWGLALGHTRPAVYAGIGRGASAGRPGDAAGTGSAGTRATAPRHSTTPGQTGEPR